MREAGLKRRGIIRQEDGFKGLLALLPPPTRRAVVLTDPPYEEKQDYARVVQTLKDAQKRFAQGCYLVWYPCLSREESRRLPEQLKKLSPDKHLLAELHVAAPPRRRLRHARQRHVRHNPPYLLREQLARNLPALANLLAQDAGARFVLDGAG